MAFENDEHIDSKSNFPTKMRLQTIVIALISLFSFFGCNSDFNANEIAKEFVEEFSDYENLSKYDIEKALLILSDLITKIEGNADLQEFIGDEGMKFCTIEGLLPVIIAETRAKSKRGSKGEKELFQVMPSTHNSLKKRYIKSGGNSQGTEFLQSANNAGAINYLQACEAVSMLIENDILDHLSQEEHLKMAYVLHNKGHSGAKSLLKEYDIEDWSDFNRRFLSLLKNQGFSYRKRKKETKKKNETSRIKQKITKLRWLQSIKKQACTGELKPMRNAYVSSYIVGLAYDDINSIL